MPKVGNRHFNYDGEGIKSANEYSQLTGIPVSEGQNISPYIGQFQGQKGTSADAWDQQAYKKGGSVSRAQRRKDNKEKIRLKKRRIDLRKKARKAATKEAEKLTVTEQKAAFTKAGSGHRGKNVAKKVVEDKVSDIYKSRTDFTKTPTLNADKKETKPKKFDYRNKMGTKMSYTKALKNAKGRTASEIANDPSFYKNTSKGKYLRGIHKGLGKEKLSSGGYIGGFRGAKGTSADAIHNKPSTKISFGNKWN